MRFAVVLTTVLMFMSNLSPQTLLFQDIWKGGVTACGANVGNGLSEYTYNLDCHIEQGSFIRKAYLMGGTRGDVFTLNVKLNDVDLVFDSSTVCTSGFISLPNQIGTSSIHYIDVTNVIGNSGSNNTLYVPEQDNITIQHFKTFYLVVLYENSSMPLVSSTILLNNSNVAPVVTYNFSEINSVSNTYDVGFGFAGWAFCNTQFDGTFIEVNNINIGLVGGNEYNSPFNCTGSQGHFYYQENELFALGDDVANEVVHESDAIANIQSYIGNMATNVSIGFIHQSPNTVHANTNPIVCAILAYTSPCQPFEASLLTSDTTTCANNPLQLGVTVPDTINATYEWLPQTNLSCYDCPNPVFIGNTTTNYTVRIWASDSCSKVLPVRVRVLPEPSFESIEITESVCGGASGSIAVASSGLSQPHTFQINGGTPQNNGNFTNLAAGAYTVTVTNAVGCSKDTVVVVGEFNNVQAAFSVNPTTGAAPLDISITNQSQNATEYFWNFSDEDGNTISQNNGHFGSAQCPIAGVYTITLIAGNGTPHCNDTASVAILVKEPFEVFAYTFVTDDTEHYQIFLSGVSEYRYNLYSLDGKLVYQKSGAVENAGHVDLWEIGSMASSMYLFRVWVKAESGDEEEIKGKLVVVR